MSEKSLYETVVEWGEDLIRMIEASGPNLGPWSGVTAQAVYTDAYACKLLFENENSACDAQLSPEQTSEITILRDYAAGIGRIVLGPSYDEQRRSWSEKVD